MILEITQVIWLETPKGQGLAKFLIDYGPESDLYWVVFIHDTREVWTFSNEEVRASENITLGRKKEKSTQELLNEYIQKEQANARDR